jgi:HAD superfamily hydrolase (TIGR01662 family)
VLTAVVFDIGETLVDESRAWSIQARRAGLTTLTLFAALGALIEAGRDHREVWDLLGVPPPGPAPPYELEDFYPDAVVGLQAVRHAGYLVGLAGNQPQHTEAALDRLGLPVEMIASSARWGVEKPAPAFFARICTELGCPAEQIAYVGDRVDNDILPAKAAGMRAIFIRRGPWGHLHARRPGADQADARIDRLDALIPSLRSL